MMLVLSQLLEWWLVSVACMRTGAVMIPGISQLTEKDLKFWLQTPRAKSITTSDSLAPRVDAISASGPSLQTKLLVSDSTTGLGPLKWRVHLLSTQPSWSLLWSASSLDPIRGEVVKAFIVLSPAYYSHDPEKLTQELQEHGKRVTAPYKYPRKGKHLRVLGLNKLGNQMGTCSLGSHSGSGTGRLKI
ncbi:hypothetical protein J1605_006203 [Eschrichtius robustus]|uniref:Uncharacterized protein n=1 Tax=Eschrichtius robustus TaxID=9764 RepID=A0AB34H4T8_ESCRO|nr:hypothetical protein J1605_006203 [Eschrichtius robustus]